MQALSCHIERRRSSHPAVQFLASPSSGRKRTEGCRRYGGVRRPLRCGSREHVLRLPRRTILLKAPDRAPSIPFGWWLGVVAVVVSTVCFVAGLQRAALPLLPHW
jgi:hypothetical protein